MQIKNGTQTTIEREFRKTLVDAAINAGLADLTGRVNLFPSGYPYSFQPTAAVKLTEDGRLYAAFDAERKRALLINDKGEVVSNPFVISSQDEVPVVACMGATFLGPPVTRAQPFYTLSSEQKIYEVSDQ